MAFLDFLLGSKEKTKQFQQYTPQQQAALNAILGEAREQLPSGIDFLSSLLGGETESPEVFEAPAMRQFYEQIIPGIAEKFTAQFGPGSSSSSAFGQQLGQAGAGLAERLAAQRAGRGLQQKQLGLQGLGQLQSLLGMGLTPQFQTAYQPAQPGFLGSFAGPAANLGLSALLGVM